MFTIGKAVINSNKTNLEGPKLLYTLCVCTNWKQSFDLAIIAGAQSLICMVCCSDVIQLYVT